MNNLFRTILKPISHSTTLPVLRSRHRKSFPQAKDCADSKLKSLIKLECKRALITGGTNGIGLAIAHELLSEKLEKLALVGIDNNAGRDAVKNLNCAYGKNKVIFVNCDIQYKKQITDCYEKVVKEIGCLDVVVNSAGILDGCNFEKEITTNVVGTIYSMLEAYKHMNNGGVILNISGLYGLKPLSPAPTLSATYHALVGLSRSFGDQRVAKRTGVRVVTLCPGITNTNFIKDASKRPLNKDWLKDLEAFLSRVERQDVDACGKSGLHVIKYASTGSVWVVAGSKLYSLNIPSWKKYRVLESQLL